MFALEIRFLTGRYAASRPDAQGEAEWPPHPARVFSALTAAMYERLQPSPGDRDALEWLAGVGAPEVLASNATRRRLNDVAFSGNGEPTTSLLRMEKRLLDNRLLPKGWKPGGPHAATTRPVGVEGDSPPAAGRHDPGR